MLEVTEEQLALEKIEHQKRTWSNKFIREHEIWLAIAMQIDSHKGKELKFWEGVMDLYKKKYG